jgi:hypothetical protein
MDSFVVVRDYKYNLHFSSTQIVVASGHTGVCDCVSDAEFPISVLVTSFIRRAPAPLIDHVPFSYGIVCVSEGTPKLVIYDMEPNATST